MDVDYRADLAVAGCIGFTAWDATEPTTETTACFREVQDYEPGQFYKRELPCILGVLQKLDHKIATIVIDGYVWLNDAKPGLGVHLYQALGNQIPVVGVAKTLFYSATNCVSVYRGGSSRPLYVSAAGIDLSHAARHIVQMAGDSRIPTLLKRVDRLCRDYAADQSGV